MKIHPLIASTLFASALILCSCSSDETNQPAPGTVGSTDSKTSENNTPRTNPNTNPEPASNPPGPQSDMHPVGTSAQ